MAQQKEGLRRSVFALERLFQTVAGFALTLGAKTLMDPWLGAGHEMDPLTGNVPGNAWALFASLVLLLVPFFHGAMRHVDSVHLFSEGETKHGRLLFDYVILFLEPLVFVMLGLSVRSAHHFLVALLFLNGLDLLWATFSFALTAPGLRKHVVKWMALDVTSVLAIGLAQRMAPDNLSWWIAGAALLRTVVDYAANWAFYFAVDNSDRSSTMNTSASATTVGTTAILKANATADASSSPATGETSATATTATAAIVSIAATTGPSARRPRVAIESPFGSSPDQVKEDEAFARKACLHALSHGANPFAMHLFFSQCLKDNAPEGRSLGIECGLDWTGLADEVWFCLREEEKFSSSMEKVLEAYHKRYSDPSRPKAVLLRFKADDTVDEEPLPPLKSTARALVG